MSFVPSYIFENIENNSNDPEVKEWARKNKEDAEQHSRDKFQRTIDLGRINDTSLDDKINEEIDKFNQ